MWSCLLQHDNYNLYTSLDAELEVRITRCIYYSLINVIANYIISHKERLYNYNNYIL